MDHICSAGHVSTDADWCSECGKPISGSIGAAPRQAGAGVCPDCATPREGSNKYCEVCRYDFIASTSFAAGNSQAPSSAPAIAPAPGCAASVSSGIQLIVQADPALDTEPDPAHPCPVGQADRVFHLDLPEMLLGRAAGNDGHVPEILVPDPGISRRHAKFMCSTAGNIDVLELGSTNGTMINGTPVQVGVIQAIKPGDEIRVGNWTRILVRQR